MTEASLPPPRTPWTEGRLILALIALWLGFGALAGTVEFWAVWREQGAAWVDAAWAPVLAGIVWVPLTLTVVAGVRRWPLLGPRAPGKLTTRAVRFALHLAASLALPFVLNALWGVGAVLLTALGAPFADMAPADIGAVTLSAGLRYLHLNAGTYWVIAGIATLWPGPASQLEIPSSTASSGDPEWLETLAVRVGGRTRVIRVEDIDWIEGAGDYAALHVGPDTHLSDQRLKHLETRLDPARFARVHRSAIVNLDRVRELVHRSHGDYEAVLVDGTRVRVSRSRRAAIADLLGR